MSEHREGDVRNGTGDPAGWPEDLWTGLPDPLTLRSVCRRVARAALAIGRSATVFEIADSGATRQIAAASTIGPADGADAPESIDAWDIPGWYAAGEPARWPEPAGPPPDLGAGSHTAGPMLMLRLTRAATPGSTTSSSAPPEGPASPRGPSLVLAIRTNAASRDAEGMASRLVRQVAPVIELASRHSTMASALDAQMRLLARLQHETGNAIASVRLATGLLALAGDSPGTCIDAILTALEDVEATLQDLAVLRRVTRARAPLTMRTSKLFERVAARVDHQLRTRGVRLATEAAADCEIRVDPDAFVHLLAGLVLHTAAFVQDGGCISVAAEGGEAGPAIVVRSGHEEGSWDALADAFSTRWPVESSCGLGIALALACECGFEVRCLRDGAGGFRLRVPAPAGMIP